MVERDLRATGPAAHQPTKADMEANASIDTAPEALAWAVTRVVVARKQAAETTLAKTK